MSYVVQFDSSAEDLEAALAQRIHIINVITDGRPKDECLETLFNAASHKLDERASSRLRTSRPDAFETAAVPTPAEAAEPHAAAALTESTSTLCFVMMPFADRFDRVYRELIVPAVTDAGLRSCQEITDQLPVFGSWTPVSRA
jgi:hypothetical protein